MPHKIFLRGKIWHYRGTAAHRQFRGTCGTSDKNLAQRIAAQAESREWEGHLDGPGANVTFAQAAIAYRQAEKSTRFLEKIEEHWKDTRIRAISPGAIRLSAMTLYPSAKAATRNRQVIVPTQAIINHAASLQWCSTIKVEKFAITPKRKEPVDEEWVTEFAAHASARLGALCVFLYGTGARIGEAVRMRWCDVNLSQGIAQLSGNKPTPWERTAHLPPALVAALANIGGSRNPDERVFGYLDPQNVKQVWDNAVKRAGIKRLTPHSCRHGFATTMLHKGYDVATVAARGGWKDGATVLKYYAHALEDMTVTNALFSTNMAQNYDEVSATSGNKRIIKA